jgi:hypothetical protein
MARGEYKFPEEPKFNTVQVNRLGYQLPVEFYSPIYDTQSAIDSSIPDLRSTIYWKPDIITSPDGKAFFDFYTADSSSTYSVVIEVVMSDGRLIYKRENAAITVK